MARDYEIVRPTLAQLRASLEAIEPDGDAVLQKALNVGDTDELEVLDGLCEELLSLGGLPAVVGRSHQVRLKCYRSLVQIGGRRG